MRLLNTKPSDTGNFIIEEFFGEPPPYAILSHTWQEMEVTYQDITAGMIDKKGFKKVKDCCKFSRANGYEYAWIDTCCIDKTSSAELSESLNSMYRWYQEADSFAESRWESLRDVLSEITSIPVGILVGDDDVETASVAQRMSWAARRETTRIEDRAYCLMGIFGINMPPIYGEGKNAFIRLQEEIMKVLDDHSIFAWRSDSEEENHGGLLATSPDAFRESSNVVPYNPFTTIEGPLTVSSKGISLELRFIGVGHPGLGLAILHCTEGMSKDNRLIAICLQDSFLTMQRFERKQCGKFEFIQLGDLKPSQYPLRRLCVQQRRPVSRKINKAGKPKDTGTALDNLHLLTNWINTNGIKDNRGRTPLSWAAEGGHEVVLELLLEKGARLDSKDEQSRTPLSWAAAENTHGAALALLLERGAAIESRDKFGRTSLSWAALKGREEAVSVLLQKGADIESEDSNSQTPLLNASKKCQAGTVKILLDNGASMESQEAGRQTPLSYTAERGYEAIVRILLERGADTESENPLGQTPLSLAAQRGQEATMKLLLEYGAKIESPDHQGHTPLIYAVDNGHTAAISLLLENGADIDSSDSGGQTPLIYAIENGHEAIVKLLLEDGADIELPDSRGQTPLSYAAEHGLEATVKLLLEKGANITSHDWRAHMIALFPFELDDLFT
ncbi:ankyrin repeat protein [Aspergillus oryzae 100-8]|uniref:Ankyrin repeat protein n=1 Tax=Aspergillus oryzae (strain 3.042) TaxID=1160506 RepID=I8ADD7_ASPO3|nr:ankyrin repeat protein [Aspergillus oryzae 3.042]KDE78088.1 ankyrin repeat protein [Aspergillus oryzae 100-8]|eukprot:EIT83537.1 ankyrin repeat protein [Aspergillus oryzae 3.042]